MAWEGVNRRRFPRANYVCIVRLRKKGSAQTFQTKTENIGCGGICVILPKKIDIFSPVEIELDLEDGQPRINCDGTIVWVIRRSQQDKGSLELFDTGIEFVNLKDKDMARIDKVVKRCLAQSKS